MSRTIPPPREHSHVFLGAAHARNERKTWAAITLTGFMMAAEIVGGSIFGSLAVVADGFHMATHAAALLIAALAYGYARHYATDPRFAFGTGKFGDLAGFTSAIILAMIALLIGYEAVQRLINPVPIAFAEAIPIACGGLLVNVVTAWLLSGGGHDHAHGHGHGHGHGHDHGHGHGDGHDHHHEIELRRIETAHGAILLQIHEDGVPARFRITFEGQVLGPEDTIAVRILRPGGKIETFTFIEGPDYFESIEVIAEPHEFEAILEWQHDGEVRSYESSFEEPVDAHAAGRDLNMRAAFVHVVADAAVSVLAIVGLLSALYFGWTWMDPAMGIVGAAVIANWAYGLVRDAGGILLDVLPDRALAERLRSEIESDGDRVTDLHLWRLGPGHLGAVLSVATAKSRSADYYRQKLGRFRSLSHVTVEVEST